MADLILTFKTQGLSDVKRGLEEYKSAVLETDSSILREWLAAKDTRQKTREEELTHLQQIEARAGIERLAQERAISARLLAEKKAAAKEESDWAALQGKAEAEAAKAAAREEAAIAKQAAREQIAAAKQAAKEEAAAKKEANASYVSWWKTTLKEKETAEKEAAQAVIDAEKAATAARTASLTQAATEIYIFQQIAQAIRTVGNAYADCIEQAAKWEQLAVGLTNMEGSAEGAAKAMNDLYQIAKAPGIEMEGAEKAYLKLRAAGEGAASAKRLIVDFSNTVALSGGGSTQFDRVLEQTTQMITNGSIMQRDVKWMKDSMPQLAVLMQNAYGTSSVEAIRKMHIGATQFISDMEKQMELLPKAGETLRSDLENTETAWSRFKAALVDTEWTKGFLNGITAELERLQKTLTGKKSDRDIYQERITEAVIARQPVTAKTVATHILTGHSGATAASQATIDAEMKAYDQGIKDTQNAEADKETAKKLADEKKRNADQAAKEAADKAAKEAARKAKADQERLAKELETNNASLKAEKQYQDSLTAYRKLGTQDNSNRLTVEEQDEVAKIQATAEKEISLAKDKYARQLEDAHHNGKLKAEAARQEAQKEIQIWDSANEKIDAIYLKQAKAQVKADQLADKSLQDRLDKVNDKIAAIETKITESNERIVNKAKLNDEDWSQKSFKSPTEINRTYDEQQSVAEQSKTIQLETNKKQLTATEASIDKRTATGEISGDQGGQEILNAQEEAAAKEREILEQTRQYEANILAKRKNAQIEFWKEVTHTVASAAETLTNSIADLVGNVQGKGSAAYKTLFATSKAFAIADASLQLADAAAKAWNTPWPGNFANVAAVMTSGAAIVSNINSLSYSGVFKDGGDIPAGSYGIAGETGQPEIIQGPAHVTSVKDTADLLGSKAPVVNIHNYAGASVSTSQGQDGSIQVIIDAVEKKLSAGIIAGGSALDTTFRRTYGMKR